MLNEGQAETTEGGGVTGSGTADAGEADVLSCCYHFHAGRSQQIVLTFATIPKHLNTSGLGSSSRTELYFHLCPPHLYPQCLSSAVASTF